MKLLKSLAAKLHFFSGNNSMIFLLYIYVLHNVGVY